MADNIFGSLAPSNSAFDGGWHTLGVLSAVSEAADLVGGRAWFPTSVPANFLWLVYRASDQVIVAQANLNTAVPSPTHPGWNEFTSASFQTPGDVDLDPAQQYIAAVATNGDFVYRGGFSYPTGSGVVTGSAGRYHNGGSGAVFPDQTDTGSAFFADVLVQAAGGPDVSATSYRIGPPRSRWNISPPRSRWKLGDPRSRWKVAAPRKEV